MAYISSVMRSFGHGGEKNIIPGARRPRASLPLNDLKKHQKHVLLIISNMNPYVFTCAEHVGNVR
jgi:hypothetical protein